MRFRVWSCAAAAVMVASVSYSFSQAAGPMKVGPWDTTVGPNGEIQVPDADFRKNWTALGTWVLSEEDEGVTDQHVVYAPPVSVAAYRKTGKFPDGTVIVKELFKTKSDYMTTGYATWQTEVVGWFVMVKDDKGRFPENDLWGDGWGWAYFDAADRDHPTTASYKEECVPCHEPAKATDWLYVQGYPGLTGD